MTDGPASGGCLCGAVRFEARGEPLWVAHCHCRSCRRHTGSAIATFVGFARRQHVYLSGAPKAFASSAGVRRSFCAACGTPLTYEADRCPDEVHVLIGTLDDPGRFRPGAHVFFAERVPWLDVADALPRYAGLARGSAEPAAWGPLHAG